MTELKIAAAVISTGLLLFCCLHNSGLGVGFRPAGTPLRLTGLMHNAAKRSFSAEWCCAE
jgi:hypothetical protein